MELKEFIEKTICAIVDSTSDLQAKYESDDVIVNPPSAQSGSDVFQKGSSNYTMRRVQNIAFDVAVTASSETAVGGKGGIKVIAVEIGAGKEKSILAEQVSRVSFNIPITLKPSADERVNSDQGSQEASQRRRLAKRPNHKF